MKKLSKVSPAFHHRENASILRSGSVKVFNYRMITTPSIPLPERFYYE